MSTATGLAESPGEHNATGEISSSVTQAQFKHGKNTVFDRFPGRQKQIEILKSLFGEVSFKPSLEKHMKDIFLFTIPFLFFDNLVKICEVCQIMVNLSKAKNSSNFPSCEQKSNGTCICTSYVHWWAEVNQFV